MKWKYNPEQGCLEWNGFAIEWVKKDFFDGNIIPAHWMASYGLLVVAVQEEDMFELMSSCERLARIMDL